VIFGLGFVIVILRFDKTNG